MAVIPKDWLLNLDDWEIQPDNIESVIFGPDWPNEDRYLIRESDNHLNSNGQFTRFMAIRMVK